VQENANSHLSGGKPLIASLSRPLVFRINDRLGKEHFLEDKQLEKL
jgi:hypothetical protein